MECLHHEGAVTEERLHEMQKNHAKAIKGMAIACVALSGVIIFLCVIGIAMMSVIGPFIQEAMVDYYDYGFDGYGSIYGSYSIGTHYGSGDFPGYYDYYDDYAAYQLAVSIINIILGLAIVAEGVVLAAGIIVLRNYNKPEKFAMVFAWSIVGAVLGFFCSGIIQGVLFIIIAVFVNSDKKLYRAGMYYPAAGAYVVPAAVQPVPPVPPVQVPGQPVPPVQPIQPASPQAGQPQPVQQLQQQAVQPQPVAYVPEGATQAPSPDQAAAQAAVQPALESAPAEGSPFESAPVEEMVESVDQIQVVGTQPDASQPDAQAAAPDSAVVDEGATVSIETGETEANDGQPSQN